MSLTAFYHCHYKYVAIGSIPDKKSLKNVIFFCQYVEQGAVGSGQLLYLASSEEMWVTFNMLCFCCHTDWIPLTRNLYGQESVSRAQ